MRDKSKVIVSICVGWMALLLVALTAPTAAQGPGTRPGSRAPNSSAPAFTIDLYERKGNSLSGAPTENGDLVTLPATVVCGDLVLFDTPSGSLSNRSSWSDVVRFCDGTSGVGNTVRLISDINFPATLVNPESLVETQTGVGDDDLDVTVYNVGNVYRIHSAADKGAPSAPKEVPEADTLLLLSGGLGGLATFLGWQWRRVKRAVR